MDKFSAQFDGMASESEPDESVADMSLSAELGPKLARQLDCFERYRTDLTDDPDPRTAALRHVSCSLMETQAIIVEALRRAMLSEGITTQNVEVQSYSVDTIIDLAKAIALITHVEMNSAKHQPPALPKLPR